MDAGVRSKRLKEIFDETPGLINAICRKFVMSWTAIDIGKQLLTVATGLLEKGSCLSVKDRLQSRLLTRFHNFLAVFLAQLNEGYNLEVLCRPNDHVSTTLKSVFVGIVDLLPCPQLKELAILDFTFHQPHLLGHVGKLPLFPFFGLVSHSVDQIIGRILGQYWNAPDSIQGKSLSHSTESDRRQRSVNFGETIEAINDHLLEILTSMDSTGYGEEVAIARVAWHAVSHNETIWKLYLADFANARFGLSFSQLDTDDYNLVCLILGNLSKYELGRRFVLLHTATRLDPVSNLVTWLAAPNGLKAVSKLQLTHRNELKTIEFFELLQGCTINVLYDDLKNIQSNPEADEAIVQWCHEYQSVVRLE